MQSMCNFMHYFVRWHEFKLQCRHGLYSVDVKKTFVSYLWLCVYGLVLRVFVNMQSRSNACVLCKVTGVLARAA